VDLTIYFPLIRHGPHRKWLLKQLFVATGTYVPSCYLATIGRYTDSHRLFLDNTRTAQKMTHPTVFLLSRVFVATGTCLPSLCLAKNGRIQFTEPLLLSNRRDTHTDRLMDGIYEVLHCDELSCQGHSEANIQWAVNKTSNKEKLLYTKIHTYLSYLST
jgi:hypothetical protein